MHARPLDMAAATGHLARLDEDYAAAARLGLRTVRESIGWRLAEPAPRRYALQRAERMARAARRHGLQVLWTLMHYGTPPDVDLFDDALIDRFAAFAGQAARVLAPLSDDAPVYTPVNEIGFLAWGVSQTSRFWPHRHGGGAEDDSRRSGYEVKRRLARAALAGMAAIRQVDPRARFLHVEPLVHVVAPQDRPDLQPLAQQVAGYQWQAWDLIAGRCEPGLGGSPGQLDLVGVNHYHSGQWEVGTERRLDWHLGDPRRRPPAHLLADAWQRYGRPLVIAETSHVGEGRAAWLEDMARQAAGAMQAGVPLLGLCLYPLVDRPDWDEAARWHRSGLFDVLPPPADGTAAPPGAWRRSPHPASVAALARWQARLPQPQDSTMPVIVVLSHLRWGFVYQRPQQLMSRLARDHRIVFVEEPVRAEGPPRMEHHQPLPGVDVLCPVTGCDAPGFNDEQRPRIAPLLASWLAAQHIVHPIAWLYTPMALPLVEVLRPGAVVYDCMDELSAFQGAPAALRAWEAELLKLADLVFTGGPSLYEARRGRHAALHCLPSGVDAAHFSPERLLPDSAEAATAATLHRAVGRPRLGFYGVIDERLDVRLVAALADADPAWQVVMAGPVVKIDPATLPQRPNLHWLGMQPYAVLPYLAAAWDVCLLPFALNASTRFISPTKTLEYMAAGRPVVSTAVHDVAMLYGDTVRVAHDTPAFIAACRDALAEAPAARAQRRAAMAATVARMSWDDGVETVRRLLAPLVRAGASDTAAASLPPRHAAV
ncbi:glycosyltransferase [Aquincola agrisoli]